LDKHIRKIFSLFVVVMIALFVMRLRAEMWMLPNWVMLGAGMLACVLVFRSFVYVFNFSYGLASMLNGAFLAAWFANAPSILLGGAMFIYGLRLFLFTWFRVHSESYAFRVKISADADAKLPVAIKCALLVQCGFLYCFHLFGVYYAGEVATLSASVIIAAVMILTGTLIEGLADAQKQKAKAIAPDVYVTSGLFSRWRHPNYVGEILVQIGLLIAGIGAVSAGWGNYAAVIVAPLYVILLMISECGRSDAYLELRFGDKAEFRQYKDNSGAFLPRIG
jgi:steroid 5-alpha reductase family enzyme